MRQLEPLGRARARQAALLGVLLLSACGGGGTTGSPSSSAMPRAQPGTASAQALADVAQAGAPPDNAAGFSSATDAAPEADDALAAEAGAAPLKEISLLQWVNPFIGTTPSPNSPENEEVDWHAGNTFPGATLPFNMVQFSPDTGYGEAGGGMGGYLYGKGVIQGMSLTHLNGTGCPVAQDIGFMPVLGNLNNSPATHVSDYQAGFSHANEQATPGFYRVGFDNGITSELTVTRRTGFGRFSFPANNDGTVILNVGRNGPGVNGAQLTLIGNDTIEGLVDTPGVCGTGGYTLYFHGQFDKPFSSFGTYAGDTLSAGSRSAERGKQTGGWVKFSNPGQVRLRVGVSYVSIANAAQNLRAENPAWDFDGLKAAAQATWNTRLNTIKVAGGSNDDLTKFYTALYRSFSHPNLNSDVNGQYLGFDGQVYTAAGWDKYSSFSGWDVYRSQVQLLGWLAPKEASDIAQSLVVDADKGGGGFPKWSMGNNDGCIMNGDSGTLIVANVYAFGATNFDTAKALQLMDHSASTPGVHSRGCETRPGIADTIAKGYAPYDSSTWSPIATTLEYSVADAALAQYAAALGDKDKFNTYLQRSQNWKNVFSNDKRFVVPRLASGDFDPGFSPSMNSGFAEGSAAQYTWMVPNNLRGLLDRLGGNDAANARLDEHFQKLDGNSNTIYAFMGNEPEHGVPWVYDFTGTPYKTQALVRRIMTERFAAAPNGLPGNDDLGATSAWYVWAALGLYPELPGVGGLVIATPQFASIKIRMGNGKLLAIKAPNAGANGTYIQGLTINGKASTSSWLPLTRLAKATTLVYTLGAEPNTAWGSAAADAPPSFDAPLSTSLVSQQARRCLDAPSGVAGTALLIWDCNNNSNQQWVRQADGSLQAHGLCLDGSDAAGAKLTACDAKRRQKWTFKANGSVIEAKSGLCLAIGSTATDNSSPVLLAACDGSPSQTWSDRPNVPTAVSLKGVQSGRCIDGPNATDGTLALLWDCNNNDNQQWMRYPDGTVTVHGKCLDASGGATLRAAIDISTCTGADNQRWEFEADGSIVNPASGLCVDVTGTAVDNTSLMALWTCSGAPNQRWASSSLPR